MRAKVPPRAMVAFALALACLAAVASLGAYLIWCSQSAITVADPDRPGAADADGFPEVDWAYWKGINPDVIGWVSVPGTDICSAIVQAPADDPTFYLTHDVRKARNHHGCPYLDADCAQDGFDSLNAVVFGHHMKRGAPMFATFADYSDGSFAREHSVVLLQTPEEKRMLDVTGAAIVSGYDRTKRTRFADEGDFGDWYAERHAECAMTLSDRPASSCVTFVTCSYTSSSNERTLVYAT